MQDNLAYLITQEVRKYGANLSSWERRVCNSRDLCEALKLARFAPPVPPILRGLRHLTANEHRKAEDHIDQRLAERLANADGKDTKRLVELGRGLPQYRKITSWVAVNTRLLRTS